jgi:S1-C subfamily serine protease
MCEPETATENVWHVLDVLEGSPAESAGLVPMGDWILGKCLDFYLHMWSRGLINGIILGWSGGALSAENDFYDLVEAVSLIYPRFTSQESDLSSYVI